MAYPLSPKIVQLTPPPRQFTVLPGVQGDTTLASETLSRRDGGGTHYDVKRHNTDLRGVLEARLSSDSI